MPRLCHDGAAHRCFGPWYVCAVFGCAMRNPRPRPDGRWTKRELEWQAEAKREREANSILLSGNCRMPKD